MTTPKKPADRAVDKETGISIRFIRQYDPTQDQYPTEMDAKTYKEFAAAFRRKMEIH